MLLEEKVFYIQRDDQSACRPTPVRPEAPREVQSEVRANLDVEVILNKPEAARATHDFLNYRQETLEMAEREIAIHEARNAIHNSYLSLATPVEQLTNMTNERNMGRNLEIVRYNLDKINGGRIGGVARVIHMPKDSGRYQIPEARAA